VFDGNKAQLFKDIEQLKIPATMPVQKNRSYRLHTKMVGSYTGGGEETLKYIVSYHLKAGIV
jgi:hypothetical protein